MAAAAFPTITIVARMTVLLATVATLTEIAAALMTMLITITIKVTTATTTNIML